MFDPSVEKISWSRKWQPIPVFLSEESLTTEEPGGLQSIRSHESDTTEVIEHMHNTCTFPNKVTCRSIGVRM